MNPQNASDGQYFGSLPNEMVLKVLGYVSKLKNCHLVSKQFRRICCVAESAKNRGVIMVLDDKKLKNLTLLDSILKSERNVKYLKISSIYQTCAESESILKLHAVFKLYGKGLVGLEFFDCVLMVTDFVRMLRRARNIEQFELRNIACLDPKPVKKSLTKNKKKLKKLEKFRKLQSLSIRYCDERILLKTYMMLKKNMLLDVNIGGPFRTDYIDYLVDNQSTLKKLTVSESNLNSTIHLMNHKEFTAFHIKAPCFCVCVPEDITDFMKNHPNLTSLDLESTEINMEILQEIVKMKQLEKLRINVVKLCSEDMILLESLSSLKEFAIVNDSCLSMRQFEAFSNIRNLKLTKFEMTHSSSSTEKDLIRLAENNPGLEYFSIPCISKKVTEVFFKNCKLLKVFNCPGTYQGSSRHATTLFTDERVRNIFNTNLIELDSPYFKPCSTLYESFPNLKKYKWYPWVIPSDEDFSTLLIQLKDMEHLEIMWSEKITKDSMVSVKNHGRNLTYLKFNNLSKYLFWSDTEIDKFFSTHPQRIVLKEKIIRIVNYT
ncbi:unnamed protein product [Diamesa serratosioi]